MIFTDPVPGRHHGLCDLRDQLNLFRCGQGYKGHQVADGRIGLVG